MEQDPKARVGAWFDGQVEKEAKKEVLSFPDRMGQIAALACSVIVIAFVAIHDTRPTGFFTDEFGTLASVLLYGMLVVGMVPVLVRLATGRKNLARLAEAGTTVVFFVALLYLLVVFPFDFSHFAEPLPRSLEFMLEWIPEALARIAMVIGIIASAILPAYTYFLYLGVKKRLAEPEFARMKAV